MREFLDDQIIKCQNGMECLLDDMKDERGDTNFVAIMLIIVILVGVAAIFRTQLENIVKAAMAKVTEFIG